MPPAGAPGQMLPETTQSRQTTRQLVVVVAQPTGAGQRVPLVITGKRRAQARNAQSDQSTVRAVRFYRALVSVGLLIFVLSVLTLQSGLVSETSFGSWANRFSLAISPGSEQNDGFSPMTRGEQLTASQLATRISFHAAEEYDNEYQRWTWGPSACSAIAMTVVMRAYGADVRVVEVTQKEIDLGVWSVELGLVNEPGLAQTANHFGFDADASRTRSLGEIIQIANEGKPVIVSIRDYYYFPTGHFVVINGGDDQYVSIIDSSDFNFQRMTHGEFLATWQSYSAVLTPRG